MSQSGTQQPQLETDPYLARFRGSFTSALRWDDLTALWETVRQQADTEWFIYAIGEQPPQQTVSTERLLHFIDEIDQLLRREHEEDYCGIVYADDLSKPSFIKIYDPHNLGVTCGFSENPPLPGWVLSVIAPIDLPSAITPPNNRRRWWQRIFSD